MRAELDWSETDGETWHPLVCPGHGSEVIDCEDAEHVLRCFADAITEGDMATGQMFRITVINEDPLCRTCNRTYSDGGDGYDGRCPSCADAAEKGKAEKRPELSCQAPRSNPPTRVPVPGRLENRRGTLTP